MPGFDAEVRASGRGSHAVVVPRAVVSALPSRRVLARIGEESFETTLGAYGGRTFLGLRKALLTTLGLAAGDPVHVDLEPAGPADAAVPDAAPTTCPELDGALADDAGFAAAWRGLPADHRSEYGRWIAAGPDAEARTARTARLRHRLTTALGRRQR